VDEFIPHNRKEEVMASEPGADPRDWHLEAIEAVRCGNKAEAIELLVLLEHWAQPFDAACKVYSQLRAYLERDDVNLAEACALLEETLAWIDGLPRREMVMVTVTEQRIADPLLN
jgi:hypothetical protein